MGTPQNPDDRLSNTTELLSSLTLSLRISVDEIPPRASGTNAPVTSAVLKSWTFLPPPKPTISSDTIPLQDRLATISTPSPRKKPQARVLPIFFLILLAGIISLFFFIRPAEVPFLHCQRLPHLFQTSPRHQQIRHCLDQQKNLAGKLFSLALAEILINYA
ncbi:MAG: hypothetical protein HC797_07885 [Anaerolineales bacterium]|nr:hypothetical protein [Anaerolineales bacterium]